MNAMHWCAVFAIGTTGWAMAEHSPGGALLCALVGLVDLVIARRWAKRANV